MSKRPLLPVIGGICCLIIAMGVSRFAYTPILPIMKGEVGFSAKMAGFLASSNYLGYLIGALLAGLINWGTSKQKTLKWTLVVNILSVACMGFSTDFTVWFFLRFVSGITSGLIFVLASSLVLDFLASKGKLTWAGFLYSGVGIGIFMTGILVPFLDSNFGWRGAWIGLGVISILLGIIVWLWLKDDVPRKEVNLAKKNEGKEKANISILLWLIIAYGLEGLGYIVSGTFLVDIVGKIPALAHFASLSWVFVGMAAIPSTILWAKFAERSGFISSLVLAYFLQAVGVVLPVIFFNIWGALVGAFLFGATFMGITTLATSYARKLYPNNSSQILGIMTAIYGVGQVIGPIVAGILVTITGQYLIPLILASSVLLLAILILIGGQLYKRNRTKGKEDGSCLT